MKSGDTVRVHVKVREGDKERIQIFEGIVIGMHRGGARASFTVRKVSFGQGVERIFPLHSPTIQKVDVVRSARVRRAKLYFLRDLKGKAARMKETVEAVVNPAAPNVAETRRRLGRWDSARWESMSHGRVRAMRTLENALRALGFCTSPVSTKWAAAAWPARSWRRPSCSIPTATSPASATPS